MRKPPQNSQRLLENKEGVSLRDECKREPVILKLPWPPSVNQAYTPIGYGRLIKTRVAREYFKVVGKILQAKRFKPFGKARLRVYAICTPQDRRPRDLGNLDKVLMDSLEKSGLFDNDAQIDDLRYIRRGLEVPGFVWLKIEEI